MWASGGGLRLDITWHAIVLRERQRTVQWCSPYCKQTSNYFSHGMATICNRLIRARIGSRYCNLTIFKCHACANETEEKDKMTFSRNCNAQSPKSLNMTRYWSTEIWMLNVGMITPGERMQWGCTAVGPSTTVVIPIYIRTILMLMSFIVFPGIWLVSES